MGNKTAAVAAPANKKSWTSYIGEYGAFIALVFLVVVISVVSPEFRTAGNFLNLLRQATFNGLIAFGMTCVIRACGQKVGRKECTNQCTVTNNERKQ